MEGTTRARYTVSITNNYKKESRSIRGGVPFVTAEGQFV